MGEPAEDRNEPIEKVCEARILDAMKERCETVSGKFAGSVLELYNFKYNEYKSWHKGTVFPITTGKEQIKTPRGENASFWTFEPKEEQRLKKLTNSLFPLCDNALMQPLYVAYNSQIDKTVVCCTECTMSFVDWIANEVQVPADGYISEDSKDISRSLLLLAEYIWDKGFVCDGLNDPGNYVMRDSKIQLIPFQIRKKGENDTTMTHRNPLAGLLQHLNTIWNDPDVTEFIAVLRNPEASLRFLLNHPLLLPPDRRMGVYLTYNSRTKLTGPMHVLYQQMGFFNWIGSIPPGDLVLQKVLTYKEGDENNTTCMYNDTPVEAHRYCRNTCSHYMGHWRKLFESTVRSKAPADIVDRKLKGCFPGFISRLYALSLNRDWIFRD